MTAPRAFVVRIYAGGSGAAAGVVEDVRSGRTRAFHDKDELWMFLGRVHGGVRGRAGRPSSRRGGRGK